jgi:glyoxylase-like metal-dependent hydrolase (beta-lactamase superfamily II)
VAALDDPNKGPKQTPMSGELPFERHFDPPIGVPEDVAPGVRRVVAPNPSPFTFRGTNTYIVGTGNVAVIDPGPDNAEHRAALDKALEGETVTAVVVTHTHRDHSPMAPALAKAHGAKTYGFGPHKPARAPHPGEDLRLDASNDIDFRPDVALADGDGVEGDGWSLVAVHTPGHTTNHICLELEGTGTLFCGDHVMAWSTTVVAPPDGNMHQFMASLDKLAERDDTLYLPGHGGALREPQRFVRLLALHRRQRETSILKKLQEGVVTIPAIVEQIYKGLDPKLRTAAGLSVLAHIEDLIERGLVTCDDDPSLTATFRPV